MDSSAQYIQVACEEARSDPLIPPPEAFAILLEAVLAVRALRGDRGVELDRYYLSNIGASEEASLNDRQLDPDLVPRVTARWLQQLREAGTSSRPTFAARNLYVAICDAQLPDMVALNRSLSPYMERLFRCDTYPKRRVPMRSNINTLVMQLQLQKGRHRRE